MGDVLQFQPRSFETSVHAVHDLRVEPDGSGGLILRFQAMPPQDFAPRSLDGVTVKLVVSRTWRKIIGKLKLIPSDTPRGPWFSFSFLPMVPELLVLVHFTKVGETHWCNVERLEFDHQDKILGLDHSLFRD